jgi:hypothetical protein
VLTAASRFRACLICRRPYARKLLPKCEVGPELVVDGDFLLRHGAPITGQEWLRSDRTGETHEREISVVDSRVLTEPDLDLGYF